MPDSGPQQLLHLVIGGELTDLEHATFKDLTKVEIVGLFPNYATAYAAWKAKAQQTVDNAQMRYFIVHLHRLMDPEVTGPGQGHWAGLYRMLSLRQLTRSPRFQRAAGSAAAHYLQLVWHTTRFTVDPPDALERI